MRPGSGWQRAVSARMPAMLAQPRFGLSVLWPADARLACREARHGATERFVRPRRNRAASQHLTEAVANE